MAKQYGSYMGGFSGRLGPAVGYMWNGIWVVRSRPGQVRNPRSAAQMAQRTAFKAEVQLAAAMRTAVMQGLTPAARQVHMTAYNLFVSINQPCFALSDSGLEVDWEHLQLSAGPVAPVLPQAPQLSADGVLSLEFDPNHGERRSRGRDLVRLYVYCPELEEGRLAAPVYRRDRRISLLLPDEYIGRRLVVYTFAVDEQGNYSPTTGVDLADLASLPAEGAPTSSASHGTAAAETQSVGVNTTTTSSLHQQQNTTKGKDEAPGGHEKSPS